MTDAGVAALAAGCLLRRLSLPGCHALGAPAMLALAGPRGCGLSRRRSRAWGCRCLVLESASGVNPCALRPAWHDGEGRQRQSPGAVWDMCCARALLSGCLLLWLRFCHARRGQTRTGWPRWRPATSACVPSAAPAHGSTGCAPRRARLEALDVSWCRGIPEEALGRLVDACPALETLTLFGCSQVGPLHPNPYPRQGPVSAVGAQYDTSLPASRQAACWEVQQQHAVADGRALELGAS